MKKYIISLILTVLFTCCANFNVERQELVVSEISNVNLSANKCRYSIYFVNKTSFGYSNWIYVEDKIGKYNIGDTLTFAIKK